MKQLPRALARWAQQLTLFPDDAAATVGALVQRLAPAFDAVVTAEQEPTGDVDGFDGIANRGSYERLLASEWMLRQAAPLEFLRRAVSGEHAFLQLALRRPAVPQSTLVLLDAGPDQLGGCRLVQLALLVLLVQRAESRKSQLYFQLLHEFGNGLYSSLSEQVVRGFLNGRTAARSSPAALGAWTEQIGYARSLWLIGPPAVTAFGERAFARVTLRERVSSEQLVDVTFDSNGRRRQVALGLPEPAQAARLIRDPFEQARAPVAKSETVASELLLSPKGSRLFHRNAEGELVSIPIPNSPRAPLGSPRHYRCKGGHVTSVGGRGRRLVWLYWAGEMVHIGYADGRKQPLAQHSAQGPELEFRALTPLAWFPGEAMAVYQAKGGTLWRTDFRTGRSLEIATGVRAWLRFRERHLVVVDSWRGGNPAGSRCVLEIKPVSEVPLIPVTAAWQDARLAAFEQESETCTLAWNNAGIWNLHEHKLKDSQRHLERVTSLPQPPRSEVVGIEAFTSRQARPGLWVLDDSRQTLKVVRFKSESIALRTQTKIQSVFVATAAPVAAVATATEVFVVDANGTQLYRGSTQR